jgi:16S rRNA (guanine527-N7)-methyltransferase
VKSLTDRFGLPATAAPQLEALLDGLADPRAPTTVHAREEAIDVHLADSLAALELEPVRTAGTLVDLGAGAGFPGLALAVALPDASVTLLESAGRKASFIAALAEAAALPNAHAVHARVEEHAGTYDVVTARALAELPVVLEYAAPLLDEGGTVVVWQGRRDHDEERRAGIAAEELGFAREDVRSVRPFPRAEHRHLHSYVKVAPTPAKYPRRAGMARKRPLGGRPGPPLPS